MLTSQTLHFFQLKSASSLPLHTVRAVTAFVWTTGSGSSITAGKSSHAHFHQGSSRGAPIQEQWHMCTKYVDHDHHVLKSSNMPLTSTVFLQGLQRPDCQFVGNMTINVVISYP